MNLTRERIRQVETRGLLKLRAMAEEEPRAGQPFEPVVYGPDDED
jgi:DNA-directed RNA polymerase sigma subunit (sigma70/sigma32)